MALQEFDCIIIGAGAAGLMCAANITNKKVLILDHSTKLAEKIRISGGGRCNFTNIYTSPKNYISANKHYMISALSQYQPQHFMELLDTYNIKYHEKTLGQMFCDNSAEDIINLLDMLNKNNNVVRKMGIEISKINYINNQYNITTTIGNYSSNTLVIATGGLSIPQIGASPFGYNIAKQFGHSIIETKPALVPLTLQPQDLETFANLAGNSFFSEVSSNQISFKENTLLTHRGLSGPAILQISSYLELGNSISINMLPNLSIIELLNKNKSSTKLLSNFLGNYFTGKLADALIKQLDFNPQLCQLSKAQIKLINLLIHDLTLKPSGTTGYKKAEVTRGGVNCDELNSKNMQSKLQTGLFFIGEVVDVTGWLGGYNFQWAWASAISAAREISKG